MASGSLPPVTILMTTWAPDDGEKGRAREEAARRALRSWERQLRYSGSLFLHVADDGSALPGYPVRVTEGTLFWEKATFSYQQRQGLGASLNKGLAEAFSRSPLVLHAVDDWELLESLDLDPWVKTLLDPDLRLGMIRLGPPHPDLSGVVKMVPEGWLLWLERHHYAFSFRPALWHERLIQTYGPFEERTSALHCEWDYNERFCGRSGPDIALALPVPWAHIYTSELSAVTPS